MLREFMKRPKSYFHTTPHATSAVKVTLNSKLQLQDNINHYYGGAVVTNVVT